MTNCNKLAAIAFVSFVVTACSARISGTYGDDQGITVYEFDRNGRANVFVLGSKIAAEYTLDGDKVLVTSAQGTVVLTRSGDKLFGPMGLELTRQTK